MTQQNSRETEEHPRFSLIVAYSNSAAMSSPSESSKGKKRRREAEIEDDGGDNTENFSLGTTFWLFSFYHFIRPIAD